MLSVAEYLYNPEKYACAVEGCEHLGRWTCDICGVRYCASHMEEGCGECGEETCIRCGPHKNCPAYDRRDSAEWHYSHPGV